MYLSSDDQPFYKTATVGLAVKIFQRHIDASELSSQRSVACFSAVLSKQSVRAHSPVVYSYACSEEQ
jgi:hypothetical protein